jgi:uncharacterized Rmd1/YagE family protein
MAVDASKGVPITTVALAGRVDLAATSARLKWPELRRYPYGSVYGLEGADRLYLFTFGAVVHDGADHVELPVLSVIESATEQRHLPETAETYYVAVDAARADDSPRVGWDQVVIHERSPELVGAVALLLGQSAALERYEHAANGLMDEALQMTKQLAQDGQPPVNNRTQISRAGRIMSDRLELGRWFYLVDKPAETWEDARIARLYDALFRNLELQERHQAMLYKLQAVATVMEMLIDIWQSRRSMLLEWAIVLLIVMELLFALLSKL